MSGEDNIIFCHASSTAGSTWLYQTQQESIMEVNYLTVQIKALPPTRSTPMKLTHDSRWLRYFYQQSEK